MTKEKPESVPSNVTDDIDQIVAATESDLELEPGEVVASGELASQLHEAEKKALLCQADLENFRRRKNRELADQRKYACLPLIENLLEVVDNLNRALESGLNEPENADSMQKGVEIVSGQLQSILQNHGCVQIESMGQMFDPNLHEAIRTQPDASPVNTVVLEVQTGFKLHDRVVRPAKVIVSAGNP